MLNLESINADITKHGGTTSDHAAVAEGVALGELVLEKAAAAVAAGQPCRSLTVQANLGDEMHKSPLVWKAIDEGAFGEDPGSIQFRHHKQLLYQLWFMFQQDEKALRAEIKSYMGLGETCKNMKMLGIARRRNKVLEEKVKENND